MRYLMKSNISPVLAAILIVLVLAVAGALVYSRTSSGATQYGAEVPKVVADYAKTHKNMPMPPIPMPGKRTMDPSGGAVGPPAAGGKN